MSQMLSLSILMKAARTGIVSGCLLLLMMGCSSKLQTRTMSGAESTATPQIAEGAEGETRPSSGEIAEGELIASEGDAPVSAPVQAEIPPGIPPIDIPVEEPARPAIRFSAPAEELAAPPMEKAESRETMESGETMPVETVPAPSADVAGRVPPTDIPVEEPARAGDEPGGRTETGEMAQQGELEPPSSSPSAEIFATPRADVSESAEPSTPEMPMAGEGSVSSSPPAASGSGEFFSQESSSASAVPPLSFEPEMPALPTLPEEAASTEAEPVLGEPELTQQPVAVSPDSQEEQTGERPEEASQPEEPVQMAKAVPEVPEAALERRMEDSLKALQDVYFQYDRFTIGQDAISVLQQNAEAMVNGLSDRHIVIEGHCDERGTESYNMVLGNRRASALKKVLMDLGVPGDQLQVVSYGKTKPFCTEQNEDCWQKNRRGHFVLKQDE